MTLRVNAWPGHIELISRNQPSSSWQISLDATAVILIGLYSESLRRPGGGRFCTFDSGVLNHGHIVQVREEDVFQVDRMRMKNEE